MSGIPGLIRCLTAPSPLNVIVLGVTPLALDRRLLGQWRARTDRAEQEKNQAEYERGEDQQDHDSNDQHHDND
jgi:hypothetical protein